MSPPAWQPVLERVAEILVASHGGGYGFGSGYLLGARLVLTARHLVDDAPAGSRVSVRLAGKPVALPADVVWRAAAPTTDLALLRLTDGPTPSVSGPPRLGLLHADPARTVTVTVTGFPSFAGVPNPAGGEIRDSYQVIAELPTHSSVKTRRLELRPRARPHTTGYRWRGVSGGAVFAEGALIGVVVTAETEAPVLHAVPLAALAEDDGFWSLLADDGAPTVLRPVRRTAAYTDRVRQLAEQIGELRDREAECADLAAFARSGDPYRWTVGPPWSGKTALAAHFAAHPPDDVDVVSFFVSRSFGEQTRQFQQEVCDQLAALLDEPHQMFSGQGALDSLWERAGERAAVRGRHLLLLVDGLDENDEAPPIAALLPARTGTHSHVLVLSRAMPPIPAAVPRSHPLRDRRRWPRTTLSPTRFADQLRDRATDELTGLLPDRDVRWVLGALAVGGPMTVDDLGAVMEAQGGTLDPYDLKTVIRGVPARVLFSIADGPAERFGFAHDELRRTTVDEVGRAVVARHRAALHAWADEYAHRKWPDDTPDYLVVHYPMVLASAADPTRLAALPSPDRLALLQRRGGHDGVATQEITEVLNALAAMDTGALRAACALAMRRYRLIEVPSDPSFGFPAPIAIAWAEQGQWARAEHLASVIYKSVEAYTGLAGIAAREGDTERFHQLAGRALAAARHRSAMSVWNAGHLAALGRTAFGLGAETWGRQVLREAEHSLPGRREHDAAGLKAAALARIAEAYAAIGERGHAVDLVGEAEDLASRAPDRDDCLRRIAFSSVAVRGVQEALRSLPPARSRVHRVRVHAECARAAAHLGHTDDSGRMLNLAERSLRHVPRTERLRALCELAEAAVRAADEGRARRLAREAAEAISLLDHRASRAQQHISLSRVHELLRDHPRADVSLDEISGRDDRLTALSGCAEAAHQVGDEERTRELLERAGKVAASIDRPRHQYDTREDFAVTVARCGNPAWSERIMRGMPRTTGRHFWERLSLSEAVARSGRLDQAGPMLALAGDETDLADRVAAHLAAGAARAGDIRLVEDLVARCSDDSHRFFALEDATIGAAEAGHFAMAARLLPLAREAFGRSGGRTRRGLERDPAATAASLAVRAGEEAWAAHFAGLIRPPDLFKEKTGAPTSLAMGGDLDAAERRALAVSMPPDRARALVAVAEIAAARGQGDRAAHLLGLALRAVSGWGDAARYALSRGWSDIAVAAARMGQVSRADEALRLLESASPDHRVPALAARAEAFARDGAPREAAATLEEAFSSLASRAGGAGEDRALSALASAGTAIDPARGRRHLIRMLAAHQRTPALLAPVVLADPELAPLAVALLGGADPPADATGDAGPG
ncbi:trypsin-like peptidase domain-containing protein [Streptomyces sp. NPDC058475]|uniref:trypsin-like peptidase domain-containing protein n=1 Tax=Streptomyces sp. NPDC058475 TaxID=3346518 RepID=UPI0036469B61